MTKKIETTRLAAPTASAARLRTATLYTFMWCAAGLMAGLAPAALTAQTMDSRAGVERAALDYLEGFYEGSEEKIRRGVHPDVVKFGFHVVAGAYEQTPMSFDEMIEYANSVRDSGRTTPASAPKRVEVLDVLDQTAVAKVYAWWGSDYLSMAKYDGEWKIVQVLWQSEPTG